MYLRSLRRRREQQHTRTCFEKYSCVRKTCFAENAKQLSFLSTDRCVPQIVPHETRTNHKKKIVCRASLKTFKPSVLRVPCIFKSKRGKKDLLYCFNAFACLLPVEIVDFTEDNHMKKKQQLRPPGRRIPLPSHTL